MKNFRLLIRQLRGRSGYVSIESVIAGSFFTVVFLLCLGFFAFVHPYTTLQRDVHTLAELAQRQGGLTLTDVQDFQNKVAQHAFVDTSKGAVEVTAVTSPSGLDAIAVDGLTDPGSNYVKRNSKEFIELVVRVPAHNEVIIPVANFFGVGGVAETYTYNETVMSERF